MNDDWWSLDGATLAQLAAERPDLHAHIAQHPHAYDDLLEWLATYGTPEVQQAVAARRSTAATATSPEPGMVDSAAPDAAPAPTEADASRGMTPRARRVVLGVVAVVVVLAIVAVVFVISTAARKREQDQRELVASTEIRVIVTDEDGSTGPAGVWILVSQGSEQINRIVTDVDGDTQFYPGKAGTFTFTIDQTALPEGFEADPSSETVDVTVSLGGSESGSLGVIDTSTPPPPVVTPPPTANATWTLSTTSGYTYDMSMSIGAPVTSGTNGSRGNYSDSTNQENEIGSVCTDFDPTRDIAIPVQLTVTAKTAGFNTPVDAAYQAGHFTYSGEAPDGLSTASLETERYFTSDTDCYEWDNTYGSAGVQWETPFSNGEAGNHRFTVIIKNYRSPLFPTGNTALLDWFMVRPANAASSQSAVGTYTVSSGPVAVTLAGTIVEDQ
jgi:type II secretory pathway pseudopilin PulG